MKQIDGESCFINDTAKASNDRHKRSRKRLDQVNAASKRCRQRQKEELQFLRLRVKELESMLKEASQANNARELLVIRKPWYTEENQAHDASEDKAITSKCLPAYDSTTEDLSMISNFLSELPRECTGLDTVAPYKFYLHPGHQDLLLLVGHLRTQTNFATSHIQSQFAHCTRIGVDGHWIRSILSPYYSSYFVTKFYPGLSPDHVRKAIYLIGSGIVNVAHNFLSREHTVLNDGTVILDGKELCDYTLMAYGKAEVTRKLLCSVWKEKEEQLIAFCSPFLRYSSVPNEDNVKWNCNGWIQCCPHIESNVSGILIRRYWSASYDTDRDSIPRVSQDYFAQHMLETLVLNLQELDLALQEAPRARIIEGPLAQVINCF